MSFIVNSTQFEEHKNQHLYLFFEEMPNIIKNYIIPKI